MSEQNDFFSPQRIDESLGLLSSTEWSDNTLRRQGHISPDVRLVQDLQSTYGLKRQHYLQALQRVEDRLIAQHLTSSAHGSFPKQTLPARSPEPLPLRTQHEGKVKYMKSKQSPPSRLGRRISVLVASLAAVAVVGSLILVLNMTGHTAVTASPRDANIPISAPQPTATPTPPDVSGKIVHTMQGVRNPVFSPDSQRVATADNGGNIQIWDAATGKHLVKVVLSNAVENDMVWSPDGKFIAVASNDGTLAIIDTKAGQVIRSIDPPTPTPTPTSVTAFVAGGSGLSSRIPKSGSGAVVPMDLAWSPDGKFLAASMLGTSSDVAGFIGVLDTQTYRMAYKLPANAGLSPFALAWSADGKYLGATVYDALYNRRIEAWNVATRQIVLDKVGGTVQAVPLALRSGTNEPLAFLSGGGAPTADSLAFQPGTDNLTFDVFGSASLQIWDVSSGQLVKDYQQSAAEMLAWSVDGKYLAYVDGATHNEVNIIDAQSGQNVFTFKASPDTEIFSFSWAPNGHYIASFATKLASTGFEVDVWTVK